MENTKTKYQEGWDSYWNSKNREDCPYEQYSSNYKDWLEGWYNAQHCDVATQPRGIGQAFNTES